MLKGAGKKLADIKGQTVNLVELSVSHYLLARGLESVGLAERDIKVVNTSDADIVSAFATPDVTATVTWKPQLSEVTAMPKTTLVFDSSKIPGEIIDLMVVNTAVLKANPKLGKALVGAWYETMALMLAKDAKATAALESMAKASGTDLAGFKGQLATTYLFCDAGRRAVRSPPSRATSSRRWTWCASSPSTTACSARARRPSTPSASSSRAASRSATRPTSRCASTRAT